MAVEAAVAPAAVAAAEVLVAAAAAAVLSGWMQVCFPTFASCSPGCELALEVLPIDDGRPQLICVPLLLTLLPVLPSRLLPPAAFCALAVSPAETSRASGLHGPDSLQLTFSAAIPSWVKAFGGPSAGVSPELDMPLVDRGCEEPASEAPPGDAGEPEAGTPGTPGPSAICVVVAASAVVVATLTS